jgi:RNA polymerase sigma-70 factor (ECF subfamily)
VASGLEGVFLENRTSLLRLLRARGAGDLAEDLLHELWIKAAASKAGPVAEPLAYLYRMANNLMLDRHRSEVQRKARQRDWVGRDSHLLGDASDEPSAERRLIAGEELRAAEAALSALGDRTEAILRRYRLDGVRQAQIAAEMGISVSAVEKHLRRAYRVLADLRSRPDAD